MQSGILSLTDIIGIAAFAFAGILAADGKKLDPVGVFVMAFTTAFGGGLVRDIIIDNRPFSGSRTAGTCGSRFLSRPLPPPF